MLWVGAISYSVICRGLEGKLTERVELGGDCCEMESPRWSGRGSNYSSFQHLSIEYLPCAKHCSRCGDREWTRQNSLPSCSLRVSGLRFYGFVTTQECGPTVAITSAFWKEKPEIWIFLKTMREFEISRCKLVYAACSTVEHKGLLSLSYDKL